MVFENNIELWFNNNNSSETFFAKYTLKMIFVEHKESSFLQVYTNSFYCTVIHIRQFYSKRQSFITDI